MHPSAQEAGQGRILSPMNWETVIIYSRLDNKVSFKAEMIDVLKEYESYWKPNFRKHLLPLTLIEEIEKWQ